MKTASEIQLEALAEAYDEMCCDVREIRTNVFDIVHLVESGRNSQEIANHARRLLTHMNSMIYSKNT